MSNDYRDRLSKNAEEFDGIVAELLDERDQLKESLGKFASRAINDAVELYNESPAAAEILRPYFERLRHLMAREACDHEWVEGNNEVVSNAEMCVKCQSVRPTTSRGMPYVHVKTGNRYYLLESVLNTTNAQGGTQRMILYADAEGHKYVREHTEFHDKFKRLQD